MISRTGTATRRFNGAIAGSHSLTPTITASSAFFAEVAKIARPSGVSRTLAAANSANAVSANGAARVRSRQKTSHPVAAAAPIAMAATATEGCRFCQMARSRHPSVIFGPVRSGSIRSASSRPKHSAARLCGRSIAIGSAATMPASQAKAIDGAGAPSRRQARPTAAKPPVQHSASNSLRPLHPNRPRTLAMITWPPQATCESGSPR
ncbi:hypothetical protein B2G71_03575 [Novosphingobium sp. PC22D]|nr:hypothetical protein B2G71_03575 [Novosphingobium sp. PC22D]